MGRLERIWIKRARMGPMDPKDTAELVPGKGLAGNANQGGHRQVTVITAERWAELEEELGATIDPRSRRANLFVSGLDLTDCRDKVLRIGSCRLSMLGETRPCDLMDKMHPGLQNAMKPRLRGGACGHVLEGGSVSAGAEAAWE